MIDLRPFQKRFIAGAFKPGILRAALSLPRGQGKSHLAAYILKRCLTPGDRLHRPGAEYLLLSGSLDQARQVLNPLVAELDESAYRTYSASTRLGVTHLATGTTLRVISSKAKTAFGIGANNPLVVADEPGAWETNQGQVMNDALETSLSKPDADMRICYIGTLAPSVSGWWHDLIDGGSNGSTFVMSLRADRQKWDKASEIRRCNPLSWDYPESRKTLFEERDAARHDTRLKARFLSYRLNVPSADESAMLLTIPDYDIWAARPVADRVGQPIVAVDLGGGRAWSAAVAVYQSGRVEALAVAPGIPSIEAQEQRDRVPSGTYSRLVERGQLLVADGLRVQPPAVMWDAIVEKWGIPVSIVCDRFRLAEMEDAVRGATGIEPRVWRYSEASFDIRALRKLCKDGPLSLDPDADALVQSSIAVAQVKNDDAGSVRMVKHHNNAARDDVAAALVLAAGAYVRAEQEVNAGLARRAA